MDTRDTLVVAPTSDGASVDLNEPASNARLDAWFAQKGRRKVGRKGSARLGWEYTHRGPVLGGGPPPPLA